MGSFRSEAHHFGIIVITVNCSVGWHVPLPCEQVGLPEAVIGASHVPVQIRGYIELVANALIGPPIVGVLGGVPSLILGERSLDLSEDPAYLKVHVEPVQAVNHAVCRHQVVLEQHLASHRHALYREVQLLLPPVHRHGAPCLDEGI